VNINTVLLKDPADALVPANVTYNAGTFTATLDPTNPLAPGITYKVVVRGGSPDPQIKDVAGNALASNASSTFTTALPPAPQVLSTTPADGVSGIPVNIAPSAKFANPLKPDTVNTSTVLLRDMSSAPVAVTVSYEPFSFTITLVPTAPLQPGMIYTATLKGGATGITDPFDQPLAADVMFGFSTAPAGPGIASFTVFAAAETPVGPIDPDGTAVELGMKFRSNVDGYVTGVRFFKIDSTNGGDHVGHLWNATTQEQLGEVMFTVESASGWQQAKFSAPIFITANTVYVISYFAPQGHPAGDNFYFGGPSAPFPDGKDNGPLHALGHVEAGGNPDGNFDGNGNGVFVGGSGFPINSFKASNYFVDVVFTPATEPPQVLSTNPAPGAAGVLTTPTITAVFSEPLADASVTDQTVLLRDAANNAVPITVSYASGAITITPTGALQPNRAYTVILKGGPSGIKDSTGVPLAADYIWSFTTAP
jgi:hypothetical protein